MSEFYFDNSYEAQRFREWLQSLSPMEFQTFCEKLLLSMPQFEDVRSEARIKVKSKVLRADFVVRAKREEVPYDIIFEVKSQPDVTPRLLDQIARRKQDVLDPESLDKFVLIVSGIANESAMMFATALGIDLWDANRMWLILATGMSQLDLSSSGMPTDTYPPIDKASSLKNALTALTPGRTDSSAFEDLIEEIFEYLFRPPLGAPIPQSPDRPRRNIRDLVMPNDSTDGFWRKMAVDYQAHYIVVDAKNYTDPIEKAEVLSIAHYLKPKGCGLFGILVTRCGHDIGADAALSSNWINDGKMIVVLKDEDLVEMIDLNANGGHPETVLSRKISDFRLGI